MLWKRPEYSFCLRPNVVTSVMMVGLRVSVCHQHVYLAVATEPEIDFMGAYFSTKI